jgi:hypothetical protein
MIERLESNRANKMRQVKMMRKFSFKTLSFIFIFSLLLALAGCHPPPPRHIENICHVFNEYPRWYWDAQKEQQRWGIPIPVLMAIIYQESSFKADAKPPRTKLLWIIPWKRPSSAYGYSQALDGTWKDYRKQTGNAWATRDAFGDATDFMGWYLNRAHNKLHIAKSDAFALYLIYHEGMGGYAKRTYTSKPWLVNVAKRVRYRAKIYEQQLNACANDLPKKNFFGF